MNNENELVTKKMFMEGMDKLEARMELKFDAKIDALVLSTQQEFAEIEEKMATKQDLFRTEARILTAIGDIGVELKNHNTRILALEKIVKP